MNSRDYDGSSQDPPARRMEEGRGNGPEHGFEIVHHPQDGLITEDDIDDPVKKGQSICCPALFMNCTPCRTRVNIVALVLLVFFSAGAAVGGFTRPPPDALLSRNKLEGTIAPSDGIVDDDFTASVDFPNDNNNNNNSGGSDTPVNIGDDSDNNGNNNNNDNNGGVTPLPDLGDDNIDFEVSSPYVVGAYYYPWHGGNFHNREGYLRQKLLPAHRPALGEYDDSRPEVIAQHLKWSRQANIGLWVTSWWGPHMLEDSNTRNVILNHQELGDMKIALHYETAGRIIDGDLSNVAPDIEYICGAYFSHPNYYSINGRPVLVIYITRWLEFEGMLGDVIRIIRETAQKFGHNPYIVGDHVFGQAPDLQDTYDSFKILDAITNYDVYGSMGRPMRYAGKEPIDDYYGEQGFWKRKALEHGCRFIPAASPGYNDRGVRLQNDHPPLSRKLTVDSEEGSSFKYQLSKALPLVDPMANNMILINSFNEWHEDTQLEPVVGTKANLPVLLTGGLEYEGYGELYLNILRDFTSSLDGNVFRSSGDGF
ncbi:MAG: hypothetical protein SGBAC_011860 [Bacillariaceae sp.]